jgi:hypothetical protein
VKPGDMLAVLAVMYKTTIQILMNDNPFIPLNRKLATGWKLTIYEPYENACRFVDTAYNQVEAAHKLRDSVETYGYLLNTDRTPIYFKKREVNQGQIGFVRTLKETPLTEIQANGYVKVIRSVPAGELLKVYGVAIHKGESLFVVDAFKWITSDPEITFYEEIPQVILDGKIRLVNNHTTDSQRYSMALAGTQTAPPIQTPQLLAPDVWIGGGSPVTDTGTKPSVTAFPTFQHPVYKRPVMQLKNAKGETTTIELRVLGFSASYQNNVQTSMTNAGWMVSVRPSGLPSLSISGILLETRATNEFDGFMERYYKYLQATKTDDYYSMGISTLFYKQTQYQGVVIGFSYTDQEVETFHRKYTMQMLVLKEKRLSSKEISAITPVVSRKTLSEEQFRSDIGALLANTITGDYYDDFE